MSEAKKPVSPKISPNTGWANEVGLTPEMLRRLYAESTDQELALKFGCSDATISYYRRKWGIPTITLRQRRDQHRGGPSLDQLTPELLTELYRKMGERQIAGLYGVKKPAIARLRALWGIESISKSERATKQEGFTQEQKEFVIGSLLGDAHLLERGVFKLNHSYAQLGYLKHGHALLAPHSLPISYLEIEMPQSGQLTFDFGYRTVQHVWLQELRKIFYPDGKKIFPSTILDQLAPRSLAYWYFDDGHVDNTTISIYLGDISWEAAEEVAARLNLRFSLPTYIKPHTKDTTCKILGVRATGHDAFFYMVRDFATEDLLYKIPSKYWPPGRVPRRYSPTPAQDVLPKDLIAKSKDWTGLVAEKKTALLADLVRFWRGVGFPHPLPRSEEIAVVHAVQPEQVIHGDRIRPLHAGQASCLAHMEHIWSARSWGCSHSPKELFEDDAQLGKVLRMVLDAGKVPNGSRVRAALRFVRRSGVYNFRPVVAKALVDKFCRPGGTVWDPCAGYGGRMMGALLSLAMPTYLACDPQRETVARLHKFSEWIDTYVSGAVSRTKLHNLPAEDFDPPSEGVDLVMTSPPYWRREVYGEEAEQCSVRYPTYESWLEGFWKVVIQKAVRFLRPGGWVVFNVDDFDLEGRRYTLIEDTKRLVLEAGLGGEPKSFWYMMPTPSNPENHEMVLCWHKPGSQLQIDELPAPVLGGEILLPTCSGCGAVKVPQDLEGGLCQKCRPSPLVEIHCRGCGVVFQAKRAFAEFCHENCRARFHRAEYRKVVPRKATFEMSCKSCGQKWTEDHPRRVLQCPSCRETSKQAHPTKVRRCAYRMCQREFVDNSYAKSMTYCCGEHRRREKLFRSGEITEVEQFRYADPVLDKGAPAKPKIWTCRKCSAEFALGDSTSNVCSSCRTEARKKTCRHCGKLFEDSSLRNNRRACPVCSPGLSSL